MKIENLTLENGKKIPYIAATFEELTFNTHPEQVEEFLALWKEKGYVPPLTDTLIFAPYNEETIGDNYHYAFLLNTQIAPSIEQFTEQFQE